MTLMRLAVYEKKTNRHDIITYVHVSLYFIHRSFSNFYVPTIKKHKHSVDYRIFCKICFADYNKADEYT